MRVWEDLANGIGGYEGQVMALALELDLQRPPVHGLLSILHVGSPFTRLHGTRRDAWTTSGHSKPRPRPGPARGDGEGEGTGVKGHG